MFRRNFLKGMFGGLAGTGIIVTATPADLTAFALPAVGAPLAAASPTNFSALPPANIRVGDHLFDGFGHLLGTIQGRIPGADERQLPFFNKAGVCIGHVFDGVPYLLHEWSGAEPVLVTGRRRRFEGR